MRPIFVCFVCVIAFSVAANPPLLQSRAQQTFRKKYAHACHAGGRVADADYSVQDLQALGAPRCERGKI